MNRVCSECTACCRLVPVKEIAKPAWTRCPHQSRIDGCKIYARRPNSCRLWSCKWLTGEGTAALRRPDRAHYVIDMLPDYITVTDNTTGKVTEQPVVQIWGDLAYPKAHRDPMLRRYLERENAVALVRFADETGVVIFPPARAGDGHWHEIKSDLSGPEHTAADKLRVLGVTGL